MHEVLRDRSHNVLFDSLICEDEKGLILQPDCADVPYFLRAYFAFKMGLPFGYSKCTRGDGARRRNARSGGTSRTRNLLQLRPGTKAYRASRTACSVYSRGLSQLRCSSFRRSRKVSCPDSDITCGPPSPTPCNPATGGRRLTTMTPITIPCRSARIRSVLAPYGHVLVLVKRVPQSGDGAGVFLAIDGQPDGTVARKRFWRGNFLFAQDPSLGSPGFKRFRPIVREKNGVERRLTNAEIAKNPSYGDFSLEQSKLSVEDFYDRMDDRPRRSIRSAR